MLKGSLSPLFLPVTPAYCVGYMQASALMYLLQTNGLHAKAEVDRGARQQQARDSHVPKVITAVCSVVVATAVIANKLPVDL